MRLALVLAAATLALAGTASAQSVICNPTKQKCDRIVPTVDIQATVQAKENNKAETVQNSDVNMQGTVQGGRNNASRVTQDGKRNVSSTAQAN